MTDVCGHPWNSDRDRLCNASQAAPGGRCLAHHSDRQLLLDRLFASPDEPRLELADSEIDAALVDLIAARIELYPDKLVRYHFSRATFTGDVEFSRATFTGEARFGGATFTGEARFREAKFGKNVLFDKATFFADAQFGLASFAGDAHFDGATFTGKAPFRGAEFAGAARFSRATFAQEAWFNVEASFGATAQFDGATFTGAAWFDESSFGDGANFKGATFGAAAQFGGARGKGPLILRSVSFKADPASIILGDVPTEITHLHLDRPLTITAGKPTTVLTHLTDSELLKPLIIGDNVQLTNTRFDGTVGLDQLRLRGNPHWPTTSRSWRPFKPICRQVTADELVGGDERISDDRLELLYRQLRASLALIVHKSEVC